MLIATYQSQYNIQHTYLIAKIRSFLQQTKK